MQWLKDGAPVPSGWDGGGAQHGDVQWQDRASRASRPEPDEGACA